MDFASIWVILKAESCWTALILYRIENKARTRTRYRTKTGGSFGSWRSSAPIRPKLGLRRSVLGDFCLPVVCHAVLTGIQGQGAPNPPPTQSMSNLVAGALFRYFESQFGEDELQCSSHHIFCMTQEYHPAETDFRRTDNRWMEEESIQRSTPHDKVSEPYIWGSP